MSCHKLLIRSAFVCALTAAAPAQAQKVVYFDRINDVQTSAVIPDQYICVFYDQSRPGLTIREVASQMAAPFGGTLGFAYSHAIKGFSLHISERGYEQMMQRFSGTFWCEPDAIATADDVLGSSRAAKGGRPGGSTPPPPPPAQTVSWGFTRVTGYVDANVAIMGNPGTGKTAWVIDSGVDYDHPDLTVDTGRSACMLRRCSSADDQYGHGTHVAGIIGAKNDGYNTVGIAAGATIVSVRVLDQRGSGPDSGVIAGIDYVYANSSVGDVVNLSLIASKSDAMNTAVARLGSKGVFVTIAAGNSNFDASLFSPASAVGVNVYTVSATDNAADLRASYSNYGDAKNAGQPIDYAEPGTGILSSELNGTVVLKTGTSMAAPHLAGILLLDHAAYDGGAITGTDPDGYPEQVGVR